MLNYIFGIIIIAVNILRVIDGLKAGYLMWFKGNYTEAFIKYMW